MVGPFEGSLVEKFVVAFEISVLKIPAGVAADIEGPFRLFVGLEREFQATVRAEEKLPQELVIAVGDDVARQRDVGGFGIEVLRLVVELKAEQPEDAGVIAMGDPPLILECSIENVRFPVDADVRGAPRPGLMNSPLEPSTGIETNPVLSGAVK